MPRSVLHLLQDEGSVQALDGAEHRKRKLMFMRMMGAASLQRAVEIFSHQFEAAADAWKTVPQIRFHDEIRRVLTRTALAWAGVPLPENEIGDRTLEFAAMVDDARSLGPANWRARRLRNRSEAWARSVVKQAREGQPSAQEASPLSIIAHHRDIDGKELDLAEAAVELLNVLRPTVAIDRFAVFAALALHQQPAWVERIRAGDAEDVESFVLEVRRFYPFFPVIGGRVAEEFDWKAHHFKIGQWVILDLYGTNHHAASWENPDEFRPERFLSWKGDPYEYVAQGAGSFEDNHRCPGEWLTIALLKETVRLLCTRLRYDVPLQDLSIDLSRMPALPESGMVMRDIRSG
ncbi:MULTISPECIES: cytochrome P450 [unclassified Sinorhizobium]|uniref:cytochrome P450 n=1 Tax=unclassified Sinorhizobium TaxID=2613772 RepID=UPI00352647F7